MSENSHPKLPKDLQEYLPLSQRPRVDESAVTGDWSGSLGDVLFALAALVDALGGGPGDGTQKKLWSAPASLPGATIAEVVTDAIDRLEHRRLLPNVLPNLLPILRRTRKPEPLAREDAVELLRELSARDGRRRVGELSIGVVCAYDLAAATGTAIEVDPVAAGAVALARATAAPLPVRTVLRSRRFHATDADWHVGSGQDAAAAASAIVLFLFGRGPLPTTPA
jgi:hypothetical protein